MDGALFTGNQLADINQVFTNREDKIGGKLKLAKFKKPSY